MKRSMIVLLASLLCTLLVGCATAEPAPTATPDPYLAVKERLGGYEYTLLRVTTLSTNSLRAQVYSANDGPVTDWVHGDDYDYELTDEFLSLDLTENAEFWYTVNDKFREAEHNDLQADTMLLLSYDNAEKDYTLIVLFGMDPPESDPYR